MNELLQQINEKFIPFWLSLSDSRGGFYGGYKDGILDRDAPKGSNMHFKMLWFFSRAYQAFKDPKLKTAADHAYRFIIDNMMDKEYGGMFYSVRFDGAPLDKTKHANNFALALYAFTAYFDITREYAVLKYAYECFNTLEFRCRREIGYREQFDNFFSPEHNSKMCDQTSERHAKTLLHILEAYVDFYYRTKDEKVRDALQYVYELLKYRVYDMKLGSFDIYMDEDLDTEYDVFDVGINMYGSWALTNAALCLGNFGRDDVEMIKKLVDTSLKEGFDGTAMINRKYAKNKEDTDRLSWVQAESIVALINIYNLTKSENYLDTAKTLWHYVKENLVLNGGWYWGKSKAGKLLDKPMCSEVRGPYHEGRMFLEVLRRGINIGL